MKPVISYIIASVQRSGTHLLGSILRNTGVAGSPDEFFLSKPGETWERRWCAPSRLAYIERVLEENTTANGVFGMVVMWSYLEQMLQMLQETAQCKNLSGSQLLAAVFERPKYVWLRRRDRVGQAVSWEIACQTGVWVQKRGEKPKCHRTPRFDFKAIDEWCRRIASHEAGWAHYFRDNQIEPLVLFYEDVVASHRAAAETVLEFLKLPAPPGTEIPTPIVEKQPDQMSDEWAAAYRKLNREKKGKLARIFRRPAP
jgi:trehalose 2-sulfotransferase